LEEVSNEIILKTKSHNNIWEITNTNYFLVPWLVENMIYIKLALVYSVIT